MLNRYLEWRERQGYAVEPNSPIFISESNRHRGKRLSYDGIYKVVKEFETATNVSLHPHQFRHTFATNMMVQGMNPDRMMTLLLSQRSRPVLALRTNSFLGQLPLVSGPTSSVCKFHLPPDDRLRLH
ncbi:MULTISPECIES: site-specific integrase [unclassified Chamaesiphon]|uniref:site-specific integrase n=1 Tax=unclassified Chamaesiphon TaxID=2620921 RepID=UPI00286AD1B2|nr:MULTISPECIES: site-specific integrase [unclassified Chamaesiphon]